MEVVFYNTSRKFYEGSFNASIFNCHLCKSRHSNYPDIERHYLTQHSNVIVVLRDDKTISVRRHFVGPKSRTPKYWIDKVNSKQVKLNAVASSPLSSVFTHSLPLTSSHSPPIVKAKSEPSIKKSTLEPRNKVGEFGLGIKKLMDDWEFGELNIPEPAEDILRLLDNPELINVIGFPIDSSDICVELIKNETNHITSHSHSRIALQNDTLRNPLQWYSIIDISVNVDKSGHSPVQNGIDDKTGNDMNINLDDVLEFVLHLQEEAAKAAAENREMDLLA